MRMLPKRAVLLLLALTTVCSCLLAGCGQQNEGPFTVTFDTQGGTPVAAQQVEKGQKIERPQDPVRTGYTLGWWLCDGEVYFFDEQMVTRDLTLTAYWESSYVTAFGHDVTGVSRAGQTAAEIEITPTIGGLAITRIKTGAFWGCNNMTTITIPASVTEIGPDAFGRCTALQAVCITDLAGWCAVSFQNYLSNPLSCAHNLYLCGAPVTDLVVPDGVTSIGKIAFYDCTSLTSVTVPESVTSIGIWAFYNCTGVTHVTIGSGVTEIGAYAFAHCRNLTDIAYTGTMAQWNAIAKNTDWDGGTGAYTVHCTDGNIEKMIEDLT